MADLEVKNFDSPDETRPFEGNGQAEVVFVAGRSIGKGTFQPGWRWSDNVKPIAGTDDCKVSHLGYVVSGRMKVFMTDGSEGEIGPGDVFAIPLRPSQSHSSKMPTTGAPLSRAQATRSSM